MSEPIDYEKCKTRRPGLYFILALIYIIVLSNLGSCDFRADRIDKAVSEIKAMKPCKP